MHGVERQQTVNDHCSSTRRKFELRTLNSLSSKEDSSVTRGPGSVPKLLCAFVEFSVLGSWMAVAWDPRIRERQTSQQNDECDDSDRR